MPKKNKKQREIDKSKWEEYDYHLPVLLDEAVKYLINENLSSDIDINFGKKTLISDNKPKNINLIDEFVYIDGTLGGGGHAVKIMQKLHSGEKLFAFDKDISAIKRAEIIFEEEMKKPSPSIVLFNTSFSKACSICEVRGNKPKGILLDLGVSSKQLDSDQRGISYRVNSPLDMRFDAGNEENLLECCANNNPTAKDILNTRSEDELAAIFRNYGEEPKSKAIARRIIEERRARPLETTFDLRNIIEECTPKIHHYKTLSRIFQAIRIEVNQELAELQKTLNDVINIIIPGGRIVVIAYHSLEDKIVKQVFKENSFAIKINKYADNSNTNQNIVNEHNTSITANTMPKIMLLNQKPIVPSEEEIMRNPRARSAKMRIAEVINNNNNRATK